MGVTDEGVDQGGVGCPYLGTDLLGSDKVVHVVQAGDVVHDLPHWEGFV